MYNAATMNEAPVQFVRTSDGYDIAYSASGQGEPVVFLPVGITHLQLVRRHDRRLADWIQRMEECFRLVCYDSRGQGMSTRQLPPDHTISDLERDLEAVVDRLNLRRFVLVGYFYSAHVAVRYAVKHPERVKALVLISASLSMSAWPLDGMISIAERNWEGFLHAWVPASFSAAERQELVDYFKRAREAKDWLVSARAFSASDITSELESLKLPTLVLHPRDFLWLPPEESVRLAASIKDARYTLLDGQLPLGDPEQTVAAITGFLSEVEFASELRDSDTGAGGEGFEGLSARQRDVLRCIAEGRTTREIAEALVLSERTVERHIADIYTRIGARNRSEATAYALGNLS
jgi:pimeloyl-ACP methyl ester carboxylesterase/DNA-binding CsgD family transcriptional regulator